MQIPELDLHPVINAMIKNSISEMKDNPFLKRLEKGNHSPWIWQTFGAARYLIAELFPSLLSAGLRKASLAGQKELAFVIEANWKDEEGLNEYGKQITEKHSIQRRQAYREMGVTDKVLTSACKDGLGNLGSYSAVCRQLISSDAHFLRTAGGILYIENTLAPELNRMYKGILQDFPKFSKQSRNYFEDHIRHDSKDHGPMLKRVAGLYQEERNISWLLYGIAEMKEAKNTFYHSLAKQLFWA